MPVSGSEAGDRDPIDARTAWLIGICTLIYFLDGLIHSILGPLAPQLAQSLQMGHAQLGPVFSANLAGQCLGLVLLPLLIPRLGQRGVVLLCVAGFGLAQAGSALAYSPESLIVWRLACGVFLGGCLPSCLAIVTQVAPPRRRGMAIMVLFTGYGLGATVAGVVAAIAGSWQAAMLGVGVACGGAALLAWKGLVLPAPVAGNDEPQQNASANPWLILAPGLALGTLMLWLLFIAMLTVSYCLNSWLPTLLVEVGREPSFAALSVSIFSLGGIVAALGVGLLIDRFGATRTLVSFLAVASVLFLVVGQVLATASGPLLLLLLAVCGFFVLGAYGGVNVVLAGYYPEALRATGIGWAKSVGRLGTLIAPVLIGSALGAGVGQGTIMSLFALPAMLALLALVLIGIVSRSRIATSASPS